MDFAQIPYLSVHMLVKKLCITICRSQWPSGLRHGSAATRLLRSWVRIPPGAWMFVCCECYVLSGRGLCDELISRLEESYRLRCVVVCNLETSRMRRPWPALGRSATGKKKCSVVNCCLLQSCLTHRYRRFGVFWCLRSQYLSFESWKICCKIWSFQGHNRRLMPKIQTEQHR